MSHICLSCRADMAKCQCGTMIKRQSGCCRPFSPIKTKTVQMTIIDHLTQTGRSPSTLNKIPTVFMEYVSNSAMNTAIITFADSSSRWDELITVSSLKRQTFIIQVVSTSAYWTDYSVWKTRDFCLLCEKSTDRGRAAPKIAERGDFAHSTTLRWILFL